jgi:hypothetical protein
MRFPPKINGIMQVMGPVVGRLSQRRHPVPLLRGEPQIRDALRRRT